MGGSGSGNWYRWGSKVTAESLYRVDIRWLKRQSCLQVGTTGSLSWSQGNELVGSICYRMKADRMILSYKHRQNFGEGEIVEETVIFDRTPCNYGGYRKWFLCPRCGKRVAVLYAGGKYFLCRHCYRLTYQSQRENKAYRLMRKVQSIREYLGASENFDEPILVKPKYMHQKTFNRLRKEAEQANRLSWSIMERLVGAKSSL